MDAGLRERVLISMIQIVCCLIIRVVQMKAVKCRKFVQIDVTRQMRRTGMDGEKVKWKRIKSEGVHWIFI